MKLPSKDNLMVFGGLLAVGLLFLVSLGYEALKAASMIKWLLE